MGLVGGGGLANISVSGFITDPDRAAILCLGSNYGV
jgi:hypothetical protein